MPDHSRASSGLEHSAAAVNARVAINDSGLAISRVGFGCASLMRLASGRRRRELIAAAIDAGLTHFDIARMYGLGYGEVELGRALRGRRNEVTIATKFGIDVSGALRHLGRFQAPARALLARSNATRDAVRNQRELFVAPRVYNVAKARLSLDLSLQKLAVDHVDILFLHDPRAQDQVDAAELQAFLYQAQAAGKIRAWGVSLDNPTQTEHIAALPDDAIVQQRHDILGQPNPQSRPTIAFGVLSAHSAIVAWLTRSADKHSAWTNAIGADPLQQDLLAKLLLAHTLNQANIAAALYSTTQTARLAVPASIIGSSPPPPGQLEAFARCLNEDRDAIGNLQRQ